MSRQEGRSTRAVSAESVDVSKLNFKGKPTELKEWTVVKSSGAKDIVSKDIATCAVVTTRTRSELRRRRI